MSIQYRMVPLKDHINPGDKKKTGYYPLVVRKKTVGIDWLAEKASAGTTLARFEVEVSIKLLMHYIEEELVNGNHVCLEGFGTFSLTAESRRVQEPDSIRAESISVKKIVFRPSRPLLKRLKHAKFEKIKSKNR